MLLDLHTLDGRYQEDFENCTVLGEPHTPLNDAPAALIPGEVPGVKDQGMGGEI